ncbi:MAG: winged helix-turn-helix transcriptional regulator [Thermoguttaceae bacterium]
MNTNTKPPILEGCAVLPPMHQGTGNGSLRRHQGDTAKTKRKHADRKTGDRFAVLNTFADFTMAGLARAEIVVWLLLWRDTKPDGLARTSQADLARRAGIDVSTAKRAVARLVRRRLLTVVFRGSLRRGPSKYRVHPTTRSVGGVSCTFPPDL